jgi:Phytanoyl-CoA dioxygenase (PhyH)
VGANADQMKSAPAKMTAHGEDFRTLDLEGFMVFKKAIPEPWLNPLRTIFDEGIIPSADWPVPRRHDWRHSSVDQDPLVQQLCELRAIIDGVRHILRAPFFLSQVEGREPCIANLPQPLHRDGAGSPGQVMAAMVWLDDYGANNGATQIVPASHRPEVNDTVKRNAIIIEGQAGDVLLFDPEVLHGATSNISGERRRSLLMLYAAASLHKEYAQTEELRHVRMDTSGIFK